MWQRAEATALEHAAKVGTGFAKKDLLKQKDRAGRRFEEKSSCSRKARRSRHLASELDTLPRRPPRLGVSPGPCGFIGDQCANNRIIELMATSNGAISAEQRPPRKRQIPNCIEHLVANEFIGKARALGIEYAVLGHHKRVFEGGAERISRTPEGRDIAHKAKGARTRDLAPEGFRSHVNREALSANQGVVEIDLGFNSESARVGQKLPDGVPHYHAHRPENLDVTPRRPKSLYADQIDCSDKRPGTAIHDWRLRTVDLNDGVVHAQSGKSRQHVLGG